MATDSITLTYISPGAEGQLEDQAERITRGEAIDVILAAKDASTRSLTGCAVTVRIYKEGHPTSIKASATIFNSDRTVVVPITWEETAELAAGDWKLQAWDDTNREMISYATIPVVENSDLTEADEFPLAGVYQPITSELTALLAALSTAGFLRRTGTNAYEVRSLVAGDIPAIAQSQVTDLPAALASFLTIVSATSTYVPKTLTVAGHALSGNVAIAASDLTNGVNGAGAVVLASAISSFVTQATTDSLYLALNGGTMNGDLAFAPTYKILIDTITTRLGGDGPLTITAETFTVALAGSGSGALNIANVLTYDFSIDTASVGGTGALQITGSAISVIGAGTLTINRAMSMASHKITDGVAGTASTDFVIKSQLDAATYGMDPKLSCRAATTANITLSGAQTIDGVAVVAGDRVLVKNQSTASQNGIYVVASGSWTRSADADASAEVTSGLSTFISEGGQAATYWTLITADPITLGSTSLTFTQTGGPGSYTAGAGLTLTGNQFSIAANSVTSAMIFGQIGAGKGGIGIDTSASALGGSLYLSAAGTWSVLAGNTTATKKWMSQTGNGSASAAPSWSVIVSADISDAASAATASVVVIRDANGNAGFVNVLEGYTSTATAAGTTTLTVASTYQQAFTGSTTQTVKLPVASTLVQGQSWLISNQSTGVLTVQSSGNNTICTVDAGQTAVLTCILTSGTNAASWAVCFMPSATALPSSIVTSFLTALGNIAQYKSGGGTPTISATGSGPGAGATVTIESGDDNAGVIKVVTGGSGTTANALIATISFSTTRTNTPKAILIAYADPQGAGSVMIAGGSRVAAQYNSLGTTSWGLYAGPSALTISTTYRFFYWVIG